MKALVGQRRSMSRKSKPEILIISSSGRSLATSAVRKQYAVGIIDMFADTDALRHSVFCERVPPAADGSFDALRLRRTFERCTSSNDSLRGWVAGSGLEASSHLLREMASCLPLIGNDPRVFEICAQPDALKRRATQLGIRCVPTHDDMPYLVKQPNTCGGWRIRLNTALTSFNTYETYLAGATISHLFLASERQISSIGFGTQWHSRHDKERLFAYGGAINRCLLREDEQRKLAEWSRCLSADMGLRGLNNIDYLWCAGAVYFLELNPRPSASMVIYDPDYSAGLFDAHINACRGHLPRMDPVSQVRAHAVIYAHRDFVLPDNFAWQKVICDRPRAGAFARGEPVCSLIVQCATVESTLSLLQREIRELIDRFNRL